MKKSGNFWTVPWLERYSFHNTNHKRFDHMPGTPKKNFFHRLRSLLLQVKKASLFEVTVDNFPCVKQNLWKCGSFQKSYSRRHFIGLAITRDRRSGNHSWCGQSEATRSIVRMVVNFTQLMTAWIRTKVRKTYMSEWSNGCWKASTFQALGSSTRET